MKNLRKETRSSLILLTIAAIVAIQLSACKKHCGDRTTEEVSITGQIQGVIIEGPWEVTITQDNADNSAILEYCSCGKNEISAQLLSNGYLHIKISSWGHFHSNDVFRATINATALKKIEASGAADIRTYGNFSGSSTDIDLSGASKVNFEAMNVEYCTVNCSGASTFKGGGYATKTSFTGSGASKLKTLSLVSENLDIDLSGASEVEVTVNNAIKGRLSGASTLKYKKAKNVSGVSTSGGSKIIKLD